MVTPSDTSSAELPPSYDATPSISLIVDALTQRIQASVSLSLVLKDLSGTKSTSGRGSRGKKRSYEDIKEWSEVPSSETATKGRTFTCKIKRSNGPTLPLHISIPPTYPLHPPKMTILAANMSMSERELQRLVNCMSDDIENDGEKAKITGSETEKCPGTGSI